MHYLTEKAQITWIFNYFIKHRERTSQLTNYKILEIYAETTIEGLKNILNYLYINFLVENLSLHWYGKRKP